FHCGNARKELSRLTGTGGRVASGGRPMSNMRRRDFITVLGGAAAVALALLTPAVGAYIDARENFVVIWGPVERGGDAVFKETVTLATRTILLGLGRRLSRPRAADRRGPATGAMSRIKLKLRLS